MWGLAFPAIVWSLHFLWCYGVNAVFCARGIGGEEVLGLAAIQLNIVVATALMGTLLVYSLLTSIARLRDPELHEVDQDRSESTDNAQRLFLARSTFAIAAVSLVSMVWIATPVFFFDTCR
jgi:hypothetical protein